MSSIFKFATEVSTPLMLAGFFAAAFFLIAKQLVARDIFPKLTKNLSSQVLHTVIDRLFILSLVALILGFIGNIVPPDGNPNDVRCDLLSSTNGNESASVTFRNFSNRTVSVYWVNYDGAQKFYFNIGPKGFKSVTSFVSHSWCVVDAQNGHPLKAVTVTSQNEDISIY